MKNVRVWYSKKDRAKYISHLDMNRCMQRAIKRSGAKIWYTEGFNPHAYLTFSLPISLGFESECETFDMRLVDDEISCDKVRDMLNAVLPEGVRIVKIDEQKNKPEEIDFADYKITVFGAEKDFAAKWNDFISAQSIICEKKTKKGTKEIDLKEHIFASNIDVSGDNAVITLRLSAGINTNINPTLVLDAFCVRYSPLYTYLSVMRSDILMSNGEAFC